MGDVVLRAELLQPVRAPAAGGDHGVLGVDLQVHLAVGDGDALADVALQNEVLALIAKVHLHAVLLQVLLDGVVDALGLLGAHVADGAVHQLQSRLDGTAADLLALLLVAQALDVGVRAELQVDLVGIVDGLLGKLRGDEGGQVAAHLVAQGKLAVGESAGAGETGGDVAVGLAVHAAAGLGLGTAAVLHRLALLHHDDLLMAALADHLQGGEDAGGAGSDDDNVGIHSFLLFVAVGFLTWRRAPLSAAAVTRRGPPGEASFSGWSGGSWAPPQGCRPPGRSPVR